MFHFNHFNFNVLNLEKSLQFYQEALGLHEVRRKEAEDGSFILVYLGDSNGDFTLELTWLRDRVEKYDLGDEEFHLAFVTDQYEEAYKNIKKWVSFSLKIQKWESILLGIRMDTGSRLFRYSNQQGKGRSFYRKRAKNWKHSYKN